MRRMLWRMSDHVLRSPFGNFFEIPLSSKSRIGHVLAKFAIAFELAFREEHIAKPLMREVLGDWPDI